MCWREKVAEMCAWHTWIRWIMQLLQHHQQVRGENKHLLTWQQITSSSVAREVLWQQLLIRRWLCSAEPCRWWGAEMTFLWPPFSAIFHADGTMRNTNKAELGHQLEAQVERVSELPQSTTSTTVYIRDAMPAIQMMGGTNSIHLTH